MTYSRFRYTTALKNAFSGGGISSLQNLDNQGWVPGTSANVFVTNHDTERVRIVLRVGVCIELIFRIRTVTP